MAPLEPGPARMHRPHVVVLGNEKGGSGKSTTAMHIILSLMEDGLSVASLDLDSRQRTLTRYIENRIEFAREKNIELPTPAHRTIHRSELPRIEDAEREEQEKVETAIAELSAGADALVIDCPGSDSYLSRVAHTYADTLITPLNDSFVDLDLLARVDPETCAIEGPSLYAEMVWESRKRRAMRDRGSIDWIVLRNRMASLDSRNTRRVHDTLGELSKRIGFRYAAGFGERVIYKEMFLKGLTLLDLRRDDLDEEGAGQLSMSQVAARQELRRLVEDLHIAARARAEMREAG